MKMYSHWEETLYNAKWEKLKTKPGAEETAPWVKGSPSKHEDLNLSPQNLCSKLEQTQHHAHRRTRRSTQTRKLGTHTHTHTAVPRDSLKHVEGKAETWDSPPMASHTLWHRLTPHAHGQKRKHSHVWVSVKQKQVGNVNISDKRKNMIA